MQKILYVANIRMPTEKAHGIQIAKTCEAFLNAGADVELVVPDRQTHVSDDVARYYGLKTKFPIAKLPVWDIVSWGAIGFFVESVQFAIKAARFARRHNALVYGRDEIVVCAVALLTSREFVWESHTGACNLIARFVARRAKRVIVISEGLREFYTARGITAEKIIVAHDGIDLTAFEHPESKKDARARLRLPQNAKIAMYIGALGSWKGTDTLLKSSTLLSDTQIVVIGAATDALKKQYPRVLFLGERPYREIASNQAAADVLVLPTSAQNIIGARYTSPLKLFTYMVSGIPIVASDVPSTREVLAENSAYWFTADDAKDLARAIQAALSDPHASSKASIAKEAVSLYTWDNRAKAILSHI